MRIELGGRGVTDVMWSRKRDTPMLLPYILLSVSRGFAAAFFSFQLSPSASTRATDHFTRAS